MASGKLSRTFGPRRDPHTIIIARGERVRHFTIGPRSLAAGSTLAVVLLAACLSVPAFVALKSDGTLQVVAQHWHERDAYEKRIASLRDQLDRVTSRQVLSDRMVETKVDVLLDQQEELTARYDKLRPLLERARDTGLIGTAIPIPTSSPRPATGDAGSADAVTSGPQDSIDDGAAPDPSAAFSPTARAAALATGTDAIETGSTGSRRFDAPEPEHHAALSSTIIDGIGKAIGRAEADQVFHLQRLAETARTKAVKIASAVSAAGIAMPSLAFDKAEGGPYQPMPASYRPSAGLDFDSSYAELDTALDALQRVQDVAATLPLDEPMPHAAITSTFGVRTDPFLGRAALHSGIDYAIARGAPITISAAGTVVHAGPMGGYGNMVEIDHGRGVTTRYGHMSRIDVAVGDKVKKGQAIGAVGSTGRSTGPHLHYEVRVDGAAIDPSRFYRIGARIASLG